MNRVSSVKEVAKLFNLPVSTLHYWEQEGLFTVQRNEKNQYRCYSLSDILKIWEIVLYRELGMPVKKIHTLLEQDETKLMATYEENEEQIKEEIDRLQLKLKRISKQKQLLKTMRELEERHLVRSVPDCKFCRKDPFDMTSMQISLNNPYQCAVYYDAENEKIERGFCEEFCEHEEILWAREKEDKAYFEFLLRVNPDDVSDNNIAAIRKEVQEKGYRTGSIIGRYLLIAASGGKRYEYYRAWVEIENKDFVNVKIL